MLRLPVLLLVTMAGIIGAMLIWGDGDLRADRRPAPAPTVAAAPEAEAVPEPQQDLTAAAAADEIAAVPEDAPPPETAEAPPAEQAGGIERFAGPTLQVSPEFADQTDAPAEAGEASLWVTATRLNMRAAPSSGASVVTGLDGGTGLVPLGPTDGDWVEVRAPSGQTGYVSSQFVTTAPPQ
ncbi:SH3 domain-containing protein [Paracoccus tibetensis]|uniref:SH3 domain-containing protein n=1 Tax=Paracoccus tibetensis TaxID=336292 RepID=A0A1G5J9D7_9RHOB|nr:SH3 domain-containing protein [Paracoccus tibetensis]SCY84530.1 SH3 domain-containing protein [Paracoccus tibetensis]